MQLSQTLNQSIVVCLPKSTEHGPTHLPCAVLGYKSPYPARVQAWHVPQGHEHAEPWTTLVDTACWICNGPRNDPAKICGWNPILNQNSRSRKVFFACPPLPVRPKEVKVTTAHQQAAIILGKSTGELSCECTNYMSCSLWNIFWNTFLNICLKPFSKKTASSVQHRPWAGEIPRLKVSEHS